MAIIKNFAKKIKFFVVNKNSYKNSKKVLDKSKKL